MTLPEKVREMRSIALKIAPEPDRPAALVACQLDGGTRFSREIDPDRMGAHFAHFLEELRAPRSRAQQSLDGQLRFSGVGARGRWASLPTPRSWPDVLADVSIGGERRHIVVVHVIDYVYLSIDLERGQVHMQLKAKALWGPGIESSFRNWANLVHFWFGESELKDRSEFHQSWRTVGVELCSDFVGIDIELADMSRVQCPGNAGVGSHGRATKETGEEIPVSTIDIGRRSSYVSWCIYRKTLQIEQVKKGDASTYRAAWASGGWDGEREVCRVELRLNSRGLRFADVETGELVNLRDPAALCDPEVLAKVWEHHTRAYRLVEPTRSRKRRCPTDPRWQVVQSAAGKPRGVTLEQDREIRMETHQEAMLRSSRAVVRELDQLAAMAGGRVAEREQLVALAQQIVRQGDPELWHAIDSGKYLETYAKARAPYLGMQMAETREALKEAGRWPKSMEALDLDWWILEGDW